MIKDCSIAILGLGSLLLSFTSSQFDFKTRIIISSIVFVLNFFSILWLLTRYVNNVKREFFKIVIYIFAALYFGLILFIQYFSIDEIQLVIKYVKPTIHFSKVERTYMENCNSWENVYDKFDRFVVAHLLGWLGKGLVVRNFLYLNVNSILFELVELKFRNILPNFYECWWDHILLDVLGCNLFGILMSIWAMKYFNVELYKWEFSDPKRRKKNIIFPKLDKLIRLFFNNSKTFAIFIFICIIMSTVDLNIFIIKAIIQIDVKESLLIYRELIMGFLGLMATYELNKNFNGKVTKKRLTPAIVLTTITIFEVIYSLRWKHVLISDNSDTTIINVRHRFMHTLFIIFLFLHVLFIL